MIKHSLFYLAFVALIGCNNEAKKAPTTDTEIATTFIRSILDDNFKEAEPFLLKDEANMQLFERFKQTYEGYSKEELANYKKADITIHEIISTGDSLRIIDYSNSYKKDIRQKLKLVWIQGKWLVDLKYTLQQ